MGKTLIKQSTRLANLDIARGLAILAVIAIHSVNSQSNFYGLRTASLGVNVTTLIATAADAFSHFAVPLFLLLSGYMLTKKYSSTKLHLLDFYKQRLWKLVPFYLLACLVYFIYRLAFYGVDPSLSSVLKGVLNFTASHHFWFVAQILLAYSVFPLLLPISKRGKLFFVLVSLAVPLAFEANMHVALLHGRALFNPPAWLANLPGLGYFLVGIGLAHYKIDLGNWAAKFSARRALALTLLVIGLTTLTTWLWLWRISSPAVDLPKGVALALGASEFMRNMVVSALVIVVATKLLQFPRLKLFNQGLATLGLYSWPIFLFHELPRDFLSSVLGRVGLPQLITLGFVFIGTVLIISMTIGLFSWATRRN